MSVNEYNRLWLYCSRANYKVGNAGFHAISAEDCNQMFQRLVQFERPDLYAVLDDKIVILEHFEFDASRNTRKGMKGRAEEAHLEKRLQKVPMDGTMHIDTARYEVSLQDWQDNFKRTFNSHYERIDAYKEHVASATGNREKTFVVGFFIEDEFPPILNFGNHVEPLPFYFTKQFAEVVQKSLKLDFVLFCGYLDGERRITYIDRGTLGKIKDRLIDLNDEDVSLSHLNGNDVVMYGGFLISSEELGND